MMDVPVPPRTRTLKGTASLSVGHRFDLKDAPKKVPPSVYTLETLGSTEERLVNASDVHPPRILELLDVTTHRKLSSVDVDRALFQPFPSRLVFQNFSPGQTYRLPLELVNHDKISRAVRLEPDDSQYFHTVCSDDGSRTVAPGLRATFTVFFSPQENKDYHHRLVFATERERFEVPVVAIGPRAVLDFHDQLVLPTCPVMATTETTQLVRNVGNSRARFELRTNRPFSVAPSSGSLDVGDSVQVTVTFNPMNVGNHRQDLILHYHTGEDVYISLSGTCQELDIHLSSDSVALKRTYITLSSVQTVSLTNTTHIPLRYIWTPWPRPKDQEAILLRDSSEEAAKRERHPAAVLHLPPPPRASQDDRCQASKNALDALSDGCITVEPMEGEIWPTLTAQFHIVFKPEEAKLYQQTIYCDITGRESRLPLTIEGEGVGPTVELNYNLCDMENIVIYDKLCYEVLVSNRGLIDAPFSLWSPNTTFGRCFSFSPEEGVVPAGEHRIVKVTFLSHVLGSFSEDLQLRVEGQPEPLTLTFRGCITGPSLHFNVSELNFEDVAFGFPQTSICTLFNTSLVPVNFSLRVLGDGLGPPSITCVKQVHEAFRDQWQGNAARDIHSQPVEFTISPATGSVDLMSSEDIKVTLCSNTVKRYRLALAVDVEGVGEEVLTLPINARCVVPDVVVETPLLDFKRCFLDHRYEQKVRLTNTSPIGACYGLIGQEYEESPSVLFGSSKPRGVMHPHSSEDIPVYLLAKAVGQQHHVLRIAVFGSSHPPLEVSLTCFGQGPVVHIQRTQLEFGKIPVLTDTIKTLQLLNQSPIPARFSTRMSHKKSFWRVEPSEGEVPFESRLELQVVAHLKDTTQCEDTLEVSIQDGQTYTVALSARGTGTTIVSDRPLTPTLDLGTHFSHDPYQYSFTLTNLGQRTHRLYWGTDGFSPSDKTHVRKSPWGRTSLPPIPTPTRKTSVGSGPRASPPRKKPVFSISPSRVELYPGCSVDMVLSGFSDSPEVVRERLECRGIVGNQGCSEHIMSVDVTCRFVAPMMSIEPKQLNFHIDKVTGESPARLYEKLVLKNISTLTVSMEMCVMAPFSLCDAHGVYSSSTAKSMVLGGGRQAGLWICFDPAFCQDRVSRVLHEFLEVRYQGHPHQDMVELHAEVHFPNLHFSTNLVDFGCVLNCTETRREITVTNCSPLPVSYCWTFLMEQKPRETEDRGHLVEERPTTLVNEEDRGSLCPSSSAPFSPSLEPHEQSSTHSTVQVEEIFDVLPIYGRLQPGEQQPVTFSFYGHSYVSREVVAQCHVEEGPTYEVQLRGEASELAYSLDLTHVDFGQQSFSHVAEAELTLKNTGKVVFEFSILQQDTEVKCVERGQVKDEEEEEEEQMSSSQPPGAEQVEMVEEVKPGQPLVIPTTGHVNAGAEKSLRVLYLPGVPEVFERRLQLQVAHLPPQDVTLTGEGVFPRVSLNLPRDLSSDCYRDVVQRATAAMDAHPDREDGTKAGGGAPTEASCILTYEDLLQMEIERILVKENAGGLLEIQDARKQGKLSKFLLPDYVLDFGFVIPGQVLSRTVNVVNIGSMAVSFSANRTSLPNTGFSAEFDRVKKLPCGETHSFTVTFDPRRADVQMGDVSVVMPIQVRGAPVVPVRLCAVVTVPGVTVSTDEVEFDTVQLGMCQMKTIQLFNQESIPCHWSIAEKLKPLKKVDKFLPLHQRKKFLQDHRPPPVVFEAVPSSGVTPPGQRVNVHVKFSPLEEQLYNRKLTVHVADGAQELYITVQGQGVEPQLEFCPAVLDLGLSLPCSMEVEAEVTVKNPCSFPIEFYCLELDSQHLEDEKILRLMQGYYDNGVLMLPPRTPGQSVLSELLDSHRDQRPPVEDDADHGKGGRAEEPPRTCAEQVQLLLSNLTTAGMAEQLRRMEADSVSRAIACHMGVDLSPDSLAVLNRNGIGIIVYGAPNTDTSKAAAALSQYYRAASLRVDAVVMETLLRGTSPVSLSARQLLEEAAAAYAQEKANDAAPTGGEGSPGAEAQREVLAPPSNSPPVSPPASPLREIMQVALQLGVDPTSLRSLLPEELLVHILAERLQSRDCHGGAVVEGLDSLYTPSPAKTLQVLLKAFDNRKHVYVVNMSDSYDAVKARQKAKKEEEEVLQKKMDNEEEQWLQELDEDKYHALPEEMKKRIDQRRKLRLKQRELKRMEKEEELRQQEAKRLQEEELKMRKKKEAKDAMKKSFLEGKQSTETLDGPTGSFIKRSKESLLDAKDQNNSTEVPDNSQHNKDDSHEAGATQTTNLGETEKSIVDELQSQFRAYEHCRVEVDHILHHWDRTQGLLLVPIPSQDPSPVPQTPVGKKSKKATSKALSPIQSQVVLQVEAHLETAKVLHPAAIPHIVLKRTEDPPSAVELLIGAGLPQLDEVLDELGLGPSGPPIPPPVTLSMVPFPKNRSIGPPASDRFIFLLPSEQDDQDEDKDESIAAKAEAAKDKDKKGRESQRGKRRASAKSRSRASGHHRSAASITAAELEEHQANVELKRSQSVTTFRWVVPANDEVVLRIWFYSNAPGTFEQMFNFELLGTQRLYQLHCTATSSYPRICKDQRTLFAHSKKVPQVEDVYHRAYVINPGFFEFGPLLCSKTRDRYKERKYQENTERLVIHNISGLEADVHFRFQHDTQASTYLLDPPTMTLKPDQKKELTVWAYPTKQGQIKETVVCCIKDNPEPVVFHLSCWGIRPELELDCKHLAFEKILVHRKDSRTLNLLNKTALPVAWRLQGMEELGDAFSVPQDHGIVPPNSCFPLSLHFRAKRQLHIKRIIRMEISDVDKILGIINTENIHVSAEAYDIAMDITPGLDFGTIRVFEEARLPLKIKNQGKYDIAYKFMLKQTGSTHSNYGCLFNVTPPSGIVSIGDKHVTVQVLCKPQKEVALQQQPVLLCQVIEPKFGNGEEPIAIIPIIVSVQSFFTRYKITPPCEVDFGPLICGCKKSQSLIIENTGVFETRFTICAVADPVPATRSGALGQSKKAPQESQSFKPTCSRLRADSFHKDSSTGPNRITTGVFSVFPCTTVLQPGSQQGVMIDCVAEQEGRWKQGLMIDISDRDPSDQPGGISYSLMAEIYKPGIVSDINSVFEEYYLCHDSSQLSCEQFCNAEGIYIIDENKFVFNKVLVGRTAKARFKLKNEGKVPCTLNLTIKHAGPKTSPPVEIFYLSSPTVCVPGQSQAYAVVSFAPQAVQLYSAMFEATAEGTSRMTPTFKSKVLEFELTGEAALPSVYVVRPVLKDSGGHPLLHFGRILIGRRRTVPLILLNDGVVPAQVQVDMLDKQGVFTLKATPGNDSTSIQSTKLQSTTDPGHQLVHRATFRLNVKEQMELEVCFCSDVPQNIEAKMTLQVEDNIYNNTIILVTAEAYQETISLDNIGRSRATDPPEDRDNYEVMDFGDCHMGQSYQESLTMTNHSDGQVVRFEWPPAGPQMSFSPQVGHLHAGCSKEVTVTFCSSQPLNLNRQSVKCRVCEVDLDQPSDQVSDWDDRPKTVQRPSACKAPTAATAGNKVVKADPEPGCSVVDGSHRDLELFISAICEYAKFSCSTDPIHFRDTMLYQTGLYQLQIVNKGHVKVEFSWDVLMDTDVNISGDRADRASSRPSTEAKGNPQAPVFSVEPSVGTIDPGSEQDFTVGFSPLEVAQFEGRLICSILNLPDSVNPPCISVRGRSLLPPCHFELDDSDYISGGHRNPEFRSPINPNTRVVEFQAVGFTTPTTRRSFFVMNPTSKPLSFKWKCEEQASRSFRCLTPNGTIQPKKKMEVCLEYEAEQVEVVESWWSFVVETLSLTIPFLFVGITREPLVYLDRAHLDFGELPVGSKEQQTVTVVNAEDVTVHLSVLPSSVLGEDHQSRLMLEPMTGSVGPKGRLTLLVSFKPQCEGYVSFRTLVKVKGKLEPLTLTAKADCVAMTTSVQVQKPGGGFREVSPDQPDSLDFGKVGISEQYTFNFLVSNQSRLSQDVTFNLVGPHHLLQHFKTKPQTAILEPGKQLYATLLFNPQNVCNLQDVKLSIKVKHGLTFTCDIRGRAVAAHLEFSFSTHNFGKCYLFSPGISPASETLVISNKGKRDISVECQFRNTPDLETDFMPHVLSPGAEMDVAVTFCPREARRYDETLSFILNTSVKRQVRILGQGVKVKGLEVELDQNHLNFGAVFQHNHSRRKVVLVNTGDVGTRFHWKKENFPPDLSVSPTDGYICPGAELPFEVSFAPVKLRNHIRSDNLCCFVEGVSSCIVLSVTGACIAASTRKEVVSFVCPARGSHTQTLTLSNPTNQQCIISPVTEGDQWSSAASISLEALESKAFPITYRPLTMTREKKHQGSVFVSFPNGSGVFYLLRGTAEAPKAEGAVVHEVPAKTQYTKLLPVKNWLPKRQRFHVLIEILKPDKPDPTVSLKGPDYIEVSALSKKHYRMCFHALRELTYNTKVTFRNETSGEYMFYLITFKTTSPRVLATVEVVSAVRQTATASIEVENPLGTAVCLSTDCKCPDINTEPQQTVPGQSKAVVSFEYLPLHVGESTARLTLCCNELGSFHYDLLLRALDPAPEKMVNFNTSLGSSLSVVIKFTNFSRVRTDYSCKTDRPDFIVDRSVTAGPGFHAGSEASVEVCFEPYKQGEVRGQLTLSSAVGGEYVFPLRGMCRPPKPQGPFSIRDGRHLSIPFKNVFLHTCTFSYQIDNPRFTVKGVDSISSKKTYGVQVTFKAPQGDFPGPWFGKLTVSSQRSPRHRKPVSWVFYLKGYRPESS